MHEKLVCFYIEVQYNLISITSENYGDGWLSLICNRIDYSLLLPELFLLRVCFSAND